MARKSEKFLELYGYHLLLGSIAAFYVFMVPYTKVEESFNVQVNFMLRSVLIEFFYSSFRNLSMIIWSCTSHICRGYSCIYCGISNCSPNEFATLAKTV